MSEPKVKYCTVTTAIDEHNIPQNYIECRFQDGQKFTAIIVDGEFNNLAFAIRDFLNSEQYQNIQGAV